MKETTATKARVYQVVQRGDGQWMIVDDRGTDIDGPYERRVDAIRDADALERAL